MPCPAEAVRFAVLLAVGARVVSEHANPADEREFEGLVEFVPLAELAQATTRALAAEAGSAAAQAQSDRIAIFRERFAPRAIFERFLRPALATAAVERAATTSDGPKITFNVIRARMSELMYRIASMKFEDPVDGEDAIRARFAELEDDIVSAFRALEDEFR